MARSSRAPAKRRRGPAQQFPRRILIGFTADEVTWLEARKRRAGLSIAAQVRDLVDGRMQTDAAS